MNKITKFGNHIFFAIFLDLFYFYDIFLIYFTLEERSSNRSVVGPGLGGNLEAVTRKVEILLRKNCTKKLRRYFKVFFIRIF